MRWMGLGAATLLAGCGPTAKFDAKCERIVVELCTHQVECDQVVSFQDCVVELQEEVYCDPERSLDELDVCLADIGTAECNIGYPASCFQVVCDQTTGCGTTGEHTGTTNTRSL